MFGVAKSTKVFKQTGIHSYIVKTKKSSVPATVKDTDKPDIETNSTINNITPPSTKSKKKRNRKKRTPPSPPEQPQPKKTILDPVKLTMEDPTMDTTNTSLDAGEEEESTMKIDLDDDALKLSQVISRNFKAEMKKRFDPITKDVNSLLQLKQTMENQRSEITIIKAENNQLKELCNKMTQEQDELKRRVARLEESKLSSNIIMHGLPETKWEKDGETLNKFYSAVAKTLDGETDAAKLEQAKHIPIISARRLGKPVENRTRPVRIKYKNEDDAITLLNNKKSLAKGVYADKEYPQEIEKCRRTLRPILKAAKNIDEFKRKCKIDGDTLIIKSQKYTINDLHKLPEKLSGFNITSNTNDDVLAFFGSLNPLSNFHPCNFTVGKNTFNSSEQLIQYTKANYFGDINTSLRILEASTPIECKQLSRDITSYVHDDWKEVAKLQCEKGITEKYLQNPRLMDVLQSTGSKKIVESCCDSQWGTGIDLRSDDALKPDKWKNTGILGEILMSIRDNYRHDGNKLDITSANSDEPPPILAPT